MTTTTKNGHAKAKTGLVRKPLADLKHPPVNEEVYRPVREDDPAVVELAQSIHDFGVKEPLLVSLDDYIISGNRRATAARLAGLCGVPCIVEQVTCNDPRFLQLLVECNRQRVKDAGELAREVIASIDPAEAHTRLRQYRRATSTPSGTVELELSSVMVRSAISDAKRPMLEAALAVIEANRDYWPLSLRQIHYRLLNDPPLRHASKPGSAYRNDRKSYQDLSDLLTRARVDGLVPWEAMADSTRTTHTFDAFSSVGQFVRQEMENFLMGYWRQLQIGQPRHVEIVAEKDTVSGILRPVARDYCVPLTIGRGYSSLPPRREMVSRYMLSDASGLVILFLSDHDPEGENIPQAFAASIVDDFGIDEGIITLVKVALTAAQAQQQHLPPVMQAKASSSRYEGFVSRNGTTTVYELEAVEPATLQEMLRASIEDVLDMGAYREQVEQEARDAAELDRIRRVAMEAMRSRLSRDAFDC